MTKMPKVSQPDPDKTRTELDEELERKLDRELEDTFPASDPPKVTRGTERQHITPRKPRDAD